ncbi:TPA: nucleotidyl transferase AbiEii/AbiGii toxin family protein [Pseudomonas aeruginosa]|uniref:nucleotidyl transferase AbiEii/AbiGii toxin family protein n=1 Tax=Pseudomonas aeruginosa TaxID=287 RepID=UPI00068E24F7|nr:nucleotidyl transferase AbiEii/AbiGii toxin family protein [Pseudomonas aeruginosa]
MSIKGVKNAAASISARLLNLARQRGDSFQHIQTRYALERLLFRISQTPEAAGYVLKGAMLFVTWPEHVYRPTRDIDLLGHGDPSPDAILELFRRICRVEVPEDGITFDPTTLSVQPVRERDRYQGICLSLEGQMGSARIPVQVDIGFGDHVYPEPEPQNFPNLLPGLPQARILMYPPETVVAEKFEAMVRFGGLNSRLKDFHDIWVIIRTFSVDLSTLLRAITGTFQRRDATVPADIPLGLTPAFAETAGELWQGFLRRNPPTYQLPPFEDLLAELRQFFGPAIASFERQEFAQGQWDPDRRSWL